MIELDFKLKTGSRTGPRAQFRVPGDPGWSSGQPEPWRRTTGRGRRSQVQGGRSWKSSGPDGPSWSSPGTGTRKPAAGPSPGAETPAGGPTGNAGGTGTYVEVEAGTTTAPWGDAQGPRVEERNTSGSPDPGLMFNY